MQGRIAQDGTNFGAWPVFGCLPGRSKRACAPRADRGNHLDERINGNTLSEDTCRNGKSAKA